MPRTQLRKTGSSKPVKNSRLTNAARLGVPPLLFLILALPVFTFSLIGDDYIFLSRALKFRVGDLLPDPGSAFYRPISRELYFGFLALLTPNNPIWGHVFNAAFAVLAVVLVAGIGRRIGGVWVGYLTGLFFALTAALPLLVGWVCCSQDLLAMVFVAVALHFRLEGRAILAVACTAAALLSKETAIFLLPALIGIPFVVSRDRSSLKRDALGVLALVVLWAAVHPKIRSFLGHGFTTGQGGYVGVDNPHVAQNAVRMFLTLLNLPSSSLGTHWPRELSWVLIPTAGMFFLAWRVAPTRERERVSEFTVLAAGALLGIVPAILTTIFAKHWFPYYSSMPAMGTSLLLAVAAKRAGPKLALGLVGAYLVLGVWHRGSEFGGRGVPTERNFRILSTDLKKVSAGLKNLHSVLPDSTRLYLSLQIPPRSYVDVNLYEFQAPQVWYVNTSVLALDPARYRSGGEPEILGWINAKFEVFEIQLPSLEVRSSGPQPDFIGYQRTLRSFAIGLLRAREVDRATSILLSMHEVDKLTWEFDRRLAAMFFFSAGRGADAEKLLATLTPLNKGEAVAAAGAAILLPPAEVDLDGPAFAAFGVSRTDADAIRYLMNFFSSRESFPQTARMAQRLLLLRPGDEEGVAMLEALRAIPKWERILPERE